MVCNRYDNDSTKKFTRTTLAALPLPAQSCAKQNVKLRLVSQLCATMSDNVTVGLHVRSIAAFSTEVLVTKDTENLLSICQNHDGFHRAFLNGLSPCWMATNRP